MKTAKGRYEQLAADRDAFLQRAYDAASLTIPSIMRTPGSGGADDLVDPFQSTGADGVLNLSSKLQLALFPPNQPYFRLVADPAAVREAEDEDPTVRTRLDEATTAIEADIRSGIETIGARPLWNEAFIHLLITGSVCYAWPEGARAPVLYPLDQHVVVRNRAGDVLELITFDLVHIDSLPDDITAKLTDKSEFVELFTWLRRDFDADVFKIHQEAGGHIISDSVGTTPLDAPSHNAIRMFRAVGESYGRSFVEYHIGDLATLEGLTQALVDGSIAASRVLWAVRPGTPVSIRTLRTAPNGSYIMADAAHIQAVQLNKHSDFSIVRQQIADLKQDLRFSFLMQRATTRAGERVTATEIRMLAQELETSLAGAYSHLADEMQLPIVKRAIHVMEARGDIPQLDPSEFRVKIVAGLEGLSRNQEITNFSIFAETLARVLGPQTAASLLQEREVAGAIAAATGVDAQRFIKTREELVAQASRAQAMQLAQRAAPSLVNQAGPIIQQQLEQ